MTRKPISRDDDLKRHAKAAGRQRAPRGPAKARKAGARRGDSVSGDWGIDGAVQAEAILARLVADPETPASTLASVAKTLWQMQAASRDDLSQVAISDLSRDEMRLEIKRCRRALDQVLGDTG